MNRQKESLRQACEIIGISVYSNENFQRYLGDCTSCNAEEILSSENFQNVSDAFQVLNNVAVDQIKDIGALYFRGIAAASLVVVKESKKYQERAIATTLFLKLCRHPASSAFGILTPNASKSIISFVFQLIMTLLKNPSKSAPKKSIKKSKEKSNKLLSQESYSSSQQEDISSSQQSNDCFSNENDAGSNEMDITNITIEEISEELQFIMVELHNHIIACYERGDENVLEGYVELLGAIICLAAVRPEFLDISESATGFLLVFLATGNQKTITIIFRSILPLFTMTGYDRRVPETPKGKISCQKSVSQFLIEVCQKVESFPIDMNQEYTPGIKTADCMEECDDIENEVNNNNNTTSTTQNDDDDDDDDDDNAVTHNQSKYNEMQIPFIYSCIVSAIQRLLITSSSDRAQVRELVASTVVAILSSLAEIEIQKMKTNEINKIVVNNDLQKNDHHPISISIRILLRFICQMSNFSKASIRVLSLQVLRDLLFSKWLEKLDRHSNEQSWMEIMLKTIKSRCWDISPSVRLKAVSSLQEFITHWIPNMSSFTTENSSAKVLSQLIFQSVDGENVVDGTTTEDMSVLEIFRHRARYDRPLVKAKATQGLGVILLIDSNDSGSGCGCGGPVSETDILLLVTGLQDKGVSVRKTSLNTLSALLLRNTRDALLKEVWVSHVLPLCFDPEPSILTALAQSVFELIVVGAMRWSDTQRKVQHVSKRTELQDTSVVLLDCAPVWSICQMILTTDRIRMLKSAVSLMIKYQYLTTTKSTTSTRSNELMTVKIEELIHVIISACSVENLKDNINDSTITDQETYRGAWIMLEALVTQSFHEKQEMDVMDAILKDADISEFVANSFLNSVTEESCGPSATASMSENVIRILTVLQKVSIMLSQSKKELIVNRLKILIAGLNLDASATSAAVAVLLSLSANESMNSSTKDEAFQMSLLSWVQPMAKAILSELSEYVLGNYKSNSYQQQQIFEGLLKDCAIDRQFDEIEVGQGCEQRAVSALYLLGELAMMGFRMEEDDFVIPVVKESSATDVDGVQLTIGASQNADSFKIFFPSPLIVLVQILMGNRFPHADTLKMGRNSSLSPICDLSAINYRTSFPDDTLRNSLPFHHNSRKNSQKVYDVSHRLSVTSSEITSHSNQIPSRIRALAFITMGRFAMRDRALAKDHVNIFLREIQTDDQSSVAVRSNALLVLGDMCVRYTTMVDRHIGSLARCLQDSGNLIRRHAFLIITQLLLQDYLKWRGMLLFRILACTVDVDKELSDLCKHSLKKTLLTKFPGFFCQHFSDAVVAFNNCKLHPSYIVAATAGNEGDSTEVVGMEGVQLEGKENRVLRFKIYEFLSENFTEEQKIQSTAKLVSDVLSYAVDIFEQSNHKSGEKKDSKTALSQASFIHTLEHAVEDVLELLQSPMLQLTTKNDKGMAEEELDVEELTLSMDDQDSSKASKEKSMITKAKSKVLKQLSLQHLVSHILPVVCSLKKSLEKRRSPLQGAVMEYLIQLMKSYKIEVEEALSADPGLQVELEYDLKMYNREKLMKKAMTLATVSNTSTESCLRSTGCQQIFSKVNSTESDSMGSSMKVPSLRKSLTGDRNSRNRTPLQSLQASGSNKIANINGISVDNIIRGSRVHSVANAVENDENTDLSQRFDVSQSPVSPQH